MTRIGVIYVVVIRLIRTSCYVCFFRIVKLDHVIRLISYGFYFGNMIRCSYVGNFFLMCNDVS